MIVLRQRVRACATATLVFIALLVYPAAPSVSAKPRLTMSVTGSQIYAPATLWIRCRLEPDANNRSLEVVADSGNFYRSSLISLDGDRAPRTISVDFRAVPGGDYEIRSVVLDSAGHEQATSRQFFSVMPYGER